MKGTRLGKDNPAYGNPYNKGKHWYTNGKESTVCFEGEQPEGWVRGIPSEVKNKKTKFSYRITNLSTKEIKTFPTTQCEECLKFLGGISKGSANTRISYALKNSGGIIRCRSPYKYNEFYDAFFVERLEGDL